MYVDINVANCPDCQKLSSIEEFLKVYFQHEVHRKVYFVQELHEVH